MQSTGRAKSSRGRAATFASLEAKANERHLTVLGGFHPTPADGAPHTCKTLLMLGPDEPGFWPAFQGSPESRDGLPDPMDRWSRRVIDLWAAEIGATAVYPFGGPPFAPFFRWAERTGRIKASPIRLLVHDVAGLMVSFRGALAFGEHIALPAPPAAPCPTCTAKPCLTACPVAAFDGTSYDVEACKDYLATPDGSDCTEQGCKARRACPVSAAYPRLAAQSAFHMKAFKGPRPCAD